jgi:hypothetical protein
MVNMTNEDAIRMFTGTLTRNVLDLLEMAGVEKKVCGAVKQSIYDRRDGFIMGLKSSESNANIVSGNY